MDFKKHFYLITFSEMGKSKNSLYIFIGTNIATPEIRLFKI